MTYFTIYGDALCWEDPLDAPLQAFWEKMVAAWRANVDYVAVFNTMNSVENPLLASTGGRITQTVLDQPVFLAMQDLTDRLGLAQKMLRSTGREDNRDPFEDTWISVTEAARRKGVTVPGLHGAIDRGDIVARPRKPGGAWLTVSQRSLDHWTPDPVRQAARKQP